MNAFERRPIYAPVRHTFARFANGCLRGRTPAKSKAALTRLLLFGAWLFPPRNDPDQA